MLSLVRYKTFADVDRALNLINYPALGENTATADALSLAYSTCFSTNRGKRPGVPDIALVVTDGKPTINPDLTVPNALILQEDDRAQTVVIAVGVSDQVDVELLCQIASPPAYPDNINFTCFYQPSFDQLVGVLVSIQNLVCNSLPIFVQPTTVPTTLAPPISELTRQPMINNAFLQ